MRLIFVRHGEPDYDNDCLTENGHIQAERTAVRLHDEPIKEIYSSPMGRARQTAGYTAKDHGLEIKILDHMQEIDWGTADPDKAPGVKYDGHPWTLAYEMMTDEPDIATGNEWSGHPYFSENICMSHYRLIAEKTDEFLKTYGIERKGKTYLCTKACDDTIALFAHGGSGACMISHIFNMPFPLVLSVFPYNVCSVSVIAFEGEEGRNLVPRFELFNDVGHIESIKPEKLKFGNSLHRGK